MNYKRIFDDTPHPFWTVLVTDDDFIFEANNKYYVDLVGFSIENTPVMESGFNDEGRATIFENYTECVRRGTVYEYEEKIVVKGQDRWWLTRMAPEFDDEGKVQRLIGISTEITDLKQAVANMEQFIHIISHDMQTPISSINGLVGMLEEEYGKSELVDIIKQSAEEANDHITGLLAYSRSARLDKSEFTWLDTNKIVDRVVETSPCELDFERTDLPRCFGNQKAISTVFSNLFTNACKYNKNPVAKIRVSFKTTGDAVVFSVADDGIGIDPMNVEKIFEPFRRLHSQRKYSGSGLGLSIARAIVVRHNGAISLTSPNELGGTTFHFSIKV